MLAPEAHIPVGKVGPGWLAARPHNAPPPVSACCPHPPPGQKEPPQPPLIILQLLQHQGSSWHPPPPAQGLLLLLLLLLQLLQLWHPPPHCTRPTAVVGELAVTVRTYATDVVPFCTNASHAHCTLSIFAATQRSMRSCQPRSSEIPFMPNILRWPVLKNRVGHLNMTRWVTLI